MPLLKYTSASRNGPMAFSMSLPSVNCKSMLKAIWMMPACRKMGRMNRNHWFGCGFSFRLPPTLGFSTPEKPHSWDRLHRLEGFSGSELVVLGH